MAAVSLGLSAGALGQGRVMPPPFFEAPGKKASDPNRLKPPPFFGEVKPPRAILPRPLRSPTTRPATRPKPVPATATRPAARPPSERTSAPATRPATQPAATQPIVLPPAPLARRVDAAVRKGLAWLYARQRPDGTWDSKYAAQQPGGAEALALWTALSAGRRADDAKLATTLSFLEKLTPRTTYVRAARALALSRLGDPRYLQLIQEDASWLVAHQGPSGGWGYGPGNRTTAERPAWTDLSNTYLAMLALSEAEDAGAKVPSNTWSRAKVYLSRAANADGGLGYQPPGGVGFRLRGSSYGSMTAASANAMLLLADRAALLGEADFLNTASRRDNPMQLAGPFARAVAWLGANFSVRGNPRWVWVASEAYEYYYFWALQDLAARGGLTSLGGKPFIRQAVEQVLAAQRGDGSWSRPAGPAGKADSLAVVRTCFALLSLLRARGCVVIDKLALGAKAGCDSRDAANLARWLSRELGWTAAWRSLDANAPPAGPSPAPLLYIQTSLSDYPAAWDAPVARFVADGGTVLVQPFAGEAPAVQAAVAFLRRALPELTAADVPLTHPVYTVRFKIPPPARPGMIGLGDACRTRAFVLKTDLSGAWHQMRLESHPQAFQLVANLLLYTTDLARPRGRLEAAAPLGPTDAPAGRLRLARIRYDGAWDVAPRAVRRLDAALRQALSVGVRELPPVGLEKPVDKGIPLLWLTGVGRLSLSDVQKNHLRQYVTGGGTLLVDAAMGDLGFAGSAVETLTDIFGAGSVVPLPAEHPLLTGEFAGGLGADITRVRFTRAAAAEVGDARAPKLMAVLLGRRVAVVLSPYSIVCPLEGVPVYDCKGLAGPDAARLAANVLLYAATARR